MTRRGFFFAPFAVFAKPVTQRVVVLSVGSLNPQTAAAVIMSNEKLILDLFRKARWPA